MAGAGRQDFPLKRHGSQLLTICSTCRSIPGHLQTLCIFLSCGLLPDNLHEQIVEPFSATTSAPPLDHPSLRSSTFDPMVSARLRHSRMATTPQVRTIPLACILTPTGAPHPRPTPTPSAPVIFQGPRCLTARCISRPPRPPGLTHLSVLVTSTVNQRLDYSDPDDIPPEMCTSTTVLFNGAIVTTVDPLPMRRAVT